MLNRPLVSDPIIESQSDAARVAWERFCNCIEQSLESPQTFQTWFKPLVPLKFDNGTLTVQVPSRFYYDWIEGHYASHIERALKETLGNDVLLNYSVGTIDDRPEEVAVAPVMISDVTSPFSTPSNEHVNLSGRLVESNLSRRHVFDNFIEGPTNRFALAASLDVSELPGKTRMNPLLIYGGVGLGKTHLIQAIGHKALKLAPNLRVLYTDSETFTKDFVESIKHKRVIEFSARCQAVDIFLFDDVQFLMGRDGTQMEFFHIFNALHQEGKQIVLTSDKPPRDIGLEERLASRIRCGLVCDIGPPDFDMRVAIVESFAEEDGVRLPPEVSSLIAEHFTKNIRHLQGAVIRLLAHLSLDGSGITLTQARNILSDLIETRQVNVPLDLVQYLVAEHYNVPVDLLIAKTRRQPVAKVRMVAMSLSLRLCGLSLKQVGMKFGNRDHTTVLHARKEVNKWINTDSEFAAAYNHLFKRIEAEAA